ncbi:hypothetical protein J6590_088407 [Homalodisca vitripennis]|nr:hypothetical protein J6590_088407 [Homalodisca vitripennis]
MRNRIRKALSIMMELSTSRCAKCDEGAIDQYALAHHQSEFSPEDGRSLLRPRKNEQKIKGGGSRFTPSAARHRAAFPLSKHRDYRATRYTRGRYYCLQKIALAINVPFKREDFSIGHRLRLYSKRHVHPLTIAQSVSRKMREEWLTAARRMRNLNASGIDPALTNSPVFFTEHLTAHNKAILWRARRLQREKKISFAGFFNGKILVKVAEGAETERVTALADLDKFDK